MAEAMPFQNKIRRLRPADKLVEEVKKQTSGAKAQIYLQRLNGTSCPSQASAEWKFFRNL
jgi:hypothetical protein